MDIAPMNPLARKFWTIPDPPIQPQINTDETQIQKMSRLYSTLYRPKFSRMPTFSPVAFNTFSS